MADYNASMGMTLTDGVTPVLDKINDRLAKLEDSFKKVEDAGTKAGDNTGSSLKRMGEIAGGIGLEDMFKKGLEAAKDFAAEMMKAITQQEQMIITIAATMTSTNSWAVANSVAVKSLDELKKAGSLVNATEEQMVGTFNTLKRTFGGTSDDAVSLTKNLSLLARQSNTTADELAGLLAKAATTGTMRMGPGGLPLQRLGIDPKELQAAQEAGKAIEYLNSKLKDNPELVEQLKNTWQYLGNELKRNKEEALELVAKGMEPLKATLKDILKVVESTSFQNGLQIFGVNASRVIKDLIEEGQVLYLLFKSIGTTMSVWTPGGASIGQMNAADQAFKDARANAVANRARREAEAAAAKWAIEHPNILDMDRSPMDTSTKNSGINPAVLEARNKAMADTLALVDQLVAKSKDQNALEDKLTAIDEERLKLIKEINKTLSGQANTDATIKVVNAIQAIKDRAIAEDSIKTQKAEQEKWDKSVKLATAGIEKEVAAREKAEADYISKVHQAQDELASISDDSYTVALAQIQKQYDHKVDAVNKDTKLEQDQKDYLIGFYQETAQAQADLLEKSTYGIQSNLKSIRDFSVGIWNDMGQAFNEGFYDVITGNVGDLKNVFKNLWNSVLKDFSTMLGNMLKNWLFTQTTMQSGSTTGAPALIGSLLGASGQTAYSASSGGIPGLQGGSSLVNGQQTGGFLDQYGVLAAGGIYAASTIYNGAQKNYQPYTIAGQSYTGDFGGNSKFGDYIAPAMAVFAGAVIAASGGLAAVAAGAALTVPVYGWIAAALILVVGAILSIINGPKEAKVDMGTYEMGQKTAIGQAMQGVYGSTYGSLANINRTGGGSSSFMSKYMNDNMEGMKSWQIQLHAGSGDDLTKDAATYFKTVLPKIFIEQAFGQKWDGGYHGDTSGGVSGHEGIPGISGVPTMVFGSFDKNAPIPKMLSNLFDFMKDSTPVITAIAENIDLKAPEEFIAWLNRIVTMVSGFKTTMTNLNQSWQDIEKGMADAKKGGVTPALAAANANILSLASEIGNYVGDEQLTKMEELQKASDAYYQSALAAVQALITMMHQIDSQAGDFESSIVSFLDSAKKNPDWLASDRNRWLTGSGADSYRSQLAGATTPDEVQTIWNNFMADAAKQLKYLEDLYNQAASGLKNMQNLAVAFDNIFGDASKNYMDINQLWTDLGDIQTQIGKAAKESGQQQLDTLTGIGASSQQLYAHLLTFIQAVNSAQTSLTQGTGGDIWQNNYAIAGNNDKSGMNMSQINMIQDKIAADMSAIGSATDPTQVTQLAGEIRGLLHTYQGFFKPGNANYNAAFLWSNQILGQLQSVGTTALTGMGASAHTIALAMGSGGQTMQTAQDLFQTALDAATLGLDALNQAVADFKGAVDIKLAGWAEGITDDMKKASDALKKAMNDFTNALGGTTTDGTTTTPGNKKNPTDGLNLLATATTDAVGDEKTGLIAFTKAINAATAAVAGS